MEIELKKLGEITTGNTPSKKDGSYWNSEDICFVKPDRIADEGITLINDSSEYISENARSKARVVSKDAVFVTCIGSIGKIGIASSGDYAFNQQINVIEPNEKVLPRYLAYNLSYSKPRLEAIANAPVVPIINKTQFGDFKLNIEEDRAKQAEIVSVLDKLTGIIEYRKIELESFDELIKVRFVEMFGDPNLNPKKWDVVNISEVVDGKVSNGFFAKRDDYCDDGNIRVLGVANIVNRMYSNLEDLPRTNADDKDIEKFEVKYGDMLFCRSSLVAEGIGKASIIPEDVQENILFECHVIRLPLDLSKCVPEFMQTLSTMDYFRNQVISQSKTATMTTIGQDGILKTDIILPPIDKQKEFYDFVKQVDKSKAAVQKSLDETQLLFNSLMQKYFG